MTSELLARPDFDDLDRHFAEFIASFGGGELLEMAVAFLSRNIRLGHICLDLTKPPMMDVAWPDLAELQRALGLNRAIGTADEATPLVLTSEGRLYLRRYWDYETLLARAIVQRCDSQAVVKAEQDLQQLAIETAVARRFVVISGGPGTGKTTTVLKILRRLMSGADGAGLRIALAAPTGKAAARLQESLRSARESYAEGNTLPKSVSTLHRLLGSRPGSVFFRHDSKNPLPVDVMIVDEASMVSLTLMAKLFDALPASARIILLGDRYQLASVEPGAVLGEIADAASEPASPLHGSLVTLQKNYRFGDDSAIAKLCELVRTGQVNPALEVLLSNSTPELGSALVPKPGQLPLTLREHVIAGYSGYLRAGSVGNALKEFLRFRVLCAMRVGPYGVVKLNRAIESILRKEGLIAGGQQTYAGMPVMVTRNDYQLHLFNGDIGILWPDESGALAVWFSDVDGSLRQVSPPRLPEHELAYAMTVHKGQGSEFENVLLILPADESPVLTRELLYTGLTRARARVDVWYREESLRAAIGRQIQRDSGLRARLSLPVTARA